MQSLTLNPQDIATLLLLNVAVLDIIEGNTTEDIIEELKLLQPELEGILYKEESPIQHTNQHAV